MGRSTLMLPTPGELSRTSDWSNLAVLVLGMGAESMAACDNLLFLGASVRMYAPAQQARGVPAAPEERIELLASLGARIDVSVEPNLWADRVYQNSAKVDLIVVDPALMAQADVGALTQGGARLMSSLDLAWTLRDPAGTELWIGLGGHFVGTGVPGLSGLADHCVATGQLAVAMLQAEGIKAELCGRAGRSVVESVMDPSPADVHVTVAGVEMLRGTRDFTFTSGCLLGVGAHESARANAGYGEPSRKQIDSAEPETAGEALLPSLWAPLYKGNRSVCIYNAEDSGTVTLVEEADVVEGARAIGVSTGTPSMSMVGLVEDVLADRAFIAERRTSAAELGTVEDLPTQEPLVLRIALTAAAVARSAGASTGSVRAALRAWHPHSV